MIFDLTNRNPGVIHYLTYTGVMWKFTENVLKVKLQTKSNLKTLHIHMQTYSHLPSKVTENIHPGGDPVLPVLAQCHVYKLGSTSHRLLCTHHLKTWNNHHSLWTGAVLSSGSAWETPKNHFSQRSEVCLQTEPDRHFTLFTFQIFFICIHYLKNGFKREELEISLHSVRGCP